MDRDILGPRNRYLKVVAAAADEWADNNSSNEDST